MIIVVRFFGFLTKNVNGSHVIIGALCLRVGFLSNQPAQLAFHSRSPPWKLWRAVFKPHPTSGIFRVRNWSICDSDISVVNLINYPTVPRSAGFCGGGSAADLKVLHICGERRLSWFQQHLRWPTLTQHPWLTQSTRLAECHISGVRQVTQQRRAIQRDIAVNSCWTAVLVTGSELKQQ